MATIDAIYATALTTLGQEAYDERVKVSEELAAQIAKDKSFFPKDRDRKEVYRFFAHRVPQIIMRISDANFQKARADYNLTGCLILKMIEEGKMF